MRKILLMACAVAMLTACEKEIASDEETSKVEQVTEVTDQNGNPVKTKKFSFTLKGDFTSEWKSVTRANEYMSADGKEMTDVWVLDYMGKLLLAQTYKIL